MTKQEKFNLTQEIKSRIDKKVQEFNAKLQKEIEEIMKEIK